MAYLRRGRACSPRGQREDSVSPGSWAAANRDCWNRRPSGPGRTGPRRCPPRAPTSSGSRAPSRRGSAPWKVTEVLVLCLRPSVRTCETYLQTGLGAGPNPEGLQSGNALWQSSERMAGLHAGPSPSSSGQRLWTRYSCRSSGSDSDELKKSSWSSGRMARHTSPR